MIDLHADTPPSELRRAHGKIKELQSVKSFRDASLVLDQADITRWQGMIGKLAEEIEVNLKPSTPAPLANRS